MESESNAAISALAALQNRLKELEFEKNNLENEVEHLKMRMDKKESSILLREQEIIKITTRAENMVLNSSKILSEINDLREENCTLNSQIRNLEELLNDSKSKLFLKNTKRQNDKIEIEMLNNKILEYEFLLSILFQPPHLLKNFKSKSSCDIDLLPMNLRRIAKRLLSLPTEYYSQPIEIKREIIQGLLCTREITSKLSYDIHKLEKQASSNSTPRYTTIEMNTLINQFKTLSRIMKRFVFSPH